MSAIEQNGSRSNHSTKQAPAEDVGESFFSQSARLKDRMSSLTLTRHRREEMRASYDLLAETAAQERQAWTELHTTQMQTDSHGKRRGSLPVAGAIAIVVALIDVFPGYWAAQALGHSPRDTWILTAILVAGLIGFAALMSHYRNSREEPMMYAAVVSTVVLIGVDTGLRLRYLLVVNKAGVLDAALEALLLAAISLGLVWIGYVKLVRAEPFPTMQLRRRWLKLRKRMDAVRGELAFAAAEYAHAWEALLAREAGRVGHESDLDKNIRKVLDDGESDLDIALRVQARGGASGFEQSSPPESEPPAAEPSPAEEAA